MTDFNGHSYRKRVKAEGMVSFRVAVKETDLWVSADRDLAEETRDLILDSRHQLESYIRSNPEFLTTLQPYPEDDYAPPIVKEMIQVTRSASVGPMASVAGAVAQFVGKGLLELTDQVIVENGGDIFLKVDRRVTVSVFAGESPLSGRIGLVVHERQMPLGVCSSSGSVGHSLSTGAADVICLLSPSPVLADGAATAVGNRVKKSKDLERAAEWADEIGGIMGGVAIMDDRMATWGDVELVGL